MNNVKRSRGTGLFTWLVLSPSLLFLLFFLVVPLLFLLGLSLHRTDSLLNVLPQYSLANYTAVLGSAVYLRSLLMTIEVAVITVLICIVLAYPAAWVLTTTSSRTLRTVLFIILISPLLTSVVIRTFAWIVLLARNGLVNDFLLYLGVIDKPLAMLWNLKAVVISYVQVLLPFLVLPIATSLGEIPEALVRASTSIGASPTHTFFKVILPLTLPGMFTGAIIVFALAAGSYITPLLIGGQLQPLLPIAVYQQAIQIGNLPLAGALAITLLVVTGAVVFLLGAVLRRWEERTYG